MPGKLVEVGKFSKESKCTVKVSYFIDGAPKIEEIEIPDENIKQCGQILP